MDLPTIGLLIIVLAWFIQAYYSFKGNKNIQPLFIVLYMIGVGFLVVGGYQAGMKTWYVELFSLVAALIALIGTRK